MTKIIPRSLIFTLIICLLATLSGTVSAQTGELELNATLSPSSEIEKTSEAKSWYRSDRITGNIDVGDFVVGPGRTELRLEPGETVVQEIIVTNRISDDRTFKLEVEDIVGSSDGSRAVMLTGEARGPYSILDYVSFPEETFTLKLGERAYIPVTISIPMTLNQGFYGSVLVLLYKQRQSKNCKKRVHQSLLG